MESDAFSDGQTQRGMDRYLDSLFDPVLSDGNTVGASFYLEMLGNIFQHSPISFIKNYDKLNKKANAFGVT